MHHHQTVDKAFEDKSRLAMQSFFTKHDIEVKELSRVWYNKCNDPRSKIAIEWEGVWQGDRDNKIYVLESKHVMSRVTISGWHSLTNFQDVINEQISRVEKMATLAGVEVDHIKLFLAGEYWLPLTRTLAIKLGYGVFYENGHDLTVEYGGPVDKV